MTKRKTNRTTGWALFALILAFALLLGSCGGGGGGGVSAPGDQTAGTTSPASDNLQFETGDPAAPVFQPGAPVTAMAVPSCPPAQGASANNSMNAFYTPANAFDGSMSTWWVGASGAGAWDLYYGFPTVRQMDSLNVTFYAASYVPAQVRLKVSADGCTWTDKGLMTGGSKPEAAVNQSVRYIWIEMTGNPASGAPLVRDVDWVQPRDNVGASGGPGSNEAFYFPSNAFDGNISTWWVGKPGAGAWNIYYMFDTPRMVPMVTANMYNLNYRPVNMKLHISNDGQNWTDLGEMEPGGSPHQFVGQTIQYLWLEMTGNPPSNAPLIKDISFDIPLGASSGDSISSTYTPARAFDGSPSTWWAGLQGQTKWELIYQYATATLVSSADITFYAASHAPVSVTAYTSMDGDTWTQQSTASGADTVSLVMGGLYRYVRFVMNGAPSVGYPVIKDISLNSQACTPECNNNMECDDANPDTVDLCYQPGSCQSACSNFTSSSTVDGGKYHTCSRRPGGNVRCWGDNFYGELGMGTSGFPPGPVSVANMTSAASISLDADHSCAVLASGQAQCWGENQLRQLGDGTNIDAYGPVNVYGLSDAAFISTGQEHSCAMKRDGATVCWGANYKGQLGTGDTTLHATPYPVSGITNAFWISAGQFTTCAVLNSGAVKCWGVNTHGQLGNGTTVDSNTPVVVTGITDALKVTVGENHACALIGGQVSCWGLNDKGQLGNGTFTESHTPVAVSGLSTVGRISAGYNHTCAMLYSGQIRCWGDNSAGQLGNGNTTNSNVPVAVSGISNAQDVGTGNRHTCANLTDGTVKCWGWDITNQLGDNAGCNPFSSVPVLVLGL